jgi:hypothetical protein
MANYHDPATIAQEYGAYAFLSRFRVSQPDLPIGLFNSGAGEALACHEWFIYVSLTVLPC